MVKEVELGRVFLQVISYFFFKQKTAYEMCGRDWSSDVCSSDLTRCLDGLSRFVALGFLDLSNNNLSWTELSKIQHLHILDLRLYGNPELERDPYCE